MQSYTTSCSKSHKSNFYHKSFKSNKSIIAILLSYFSVDFSLNYTANVKQVYNLTFSHCFHMWIADLHTISHTQHGSTFTNHLHTKFYTPNIQVAFVIVNKTKAKDNLHKCYTCYFAFYKNVTYSKTVFFQINYHTPFHDHKVTIVFFRLTRSRDRHVITTVCRNIKCTALAFNGAQFIPLVQIMKRDTQTQTA
jgi:hypothetical protein